jgi:hypothetical protein
VEVGVAGRWATALPLPTVDGYDDDVVAETEA